MLEMMLEKEWLCFKKKKTLEVNLLPSIQVAQMKVNMLLQPGK